MRRRLDRGATTRRPSSPAALAGDRAIERRLVGSADRGTTTQDARHRRRPAALRAWTEECRRRRRRAGSARRWWRRSAARRRLRRRDPLGLRQGDARRRVGRERRGARARGAAPGYRRSEERRYSLYGGADFITPNARELARATRLPTGTESPRRRRRARARDARGRMPALLFTRAEDGMLLVRAAARPCERGRGRAGGVRRLRRRRHGDRRPRGSPSPPACRSRRPLRIANAAAGIVVGKLGTATVGAEELQEGSTSPARGDGGMPEGSAARGVDAARGGSGRWRRHGLRVGFTNGCFDLLHAGHVSSAGAARRCCDRLVVGLNRGRLRGAAEGPGSRPVKRGGPRRGAVSPAGRRCGAAFEEDTPVELIRVLRPDVLVKGADYTEERVVGGELVRASGGQVRLVELCRAVRQPALRRDCADNGRRGRAEGPGRFSAADYCAAGGWRRARRR